MYKKKKVTEPNSQNTNKSFFVGHNRSIKKLPSKKHNTDVSNSGNNCKPEKLSAVNNSNSAPTICKFCSSTDHSSFKCRKYPDAHSRQARVNELSCCNFCFSTKHENGACQSKGISFPCSICKSKLHVSPLCPEFKPMSL